MNIEIPLKGRKTGKNQISKQGFYTHGDMQNDRHTDTKAMCPFQKFSGSNYNASLREVWNSYKAGKSHGSLVGEQVADVLDGARVPTKASVQWNRYKTDGWLNIASILEQCHSAVRAWIMVARTLCSSELANFNPAKALAYLCWFCKD